MFFFSQADENEKLKSVKFLLETKLDQCAKQLLIKLIRHFKILLNKNYYHSLEMIDINKIFGSFIINLPKEFNLSNKKCEEIQNINCQRKILLSLMAITEDKDYWNNVCGSGIIKIEIYNLKIDFLQFLIPKLRINAHLISNKNDTISAKEQ